MKKVVLTLAVLFTVSFFIGCTEQNENGLTDDEQLVYEVYNVDRGDIERPGSQGGN